MTGRGKRLFFLLAVIFMFFFSGTSCKCGAEVSEKETGDILFSAAYTKQEPLTLTYGTVDVMKAFSLRYGDEGAKEEKLIRGLAEAEGGDMLDAIVNLQEETVTFTPRKVSKGPLQVRLSMETEHYRFERDIYVQVAPLALVLDCGSAAVSAPGKEEYTNRKVYDGGDRVDVKATWRAAEGQAVTAGTAREIEHYFKNVVFRRYASGRTNVRGENEVQAFTFAPVDLSLCTDITDERVRESYRIREGEKEKDLPLAVEKRSLRLAVADSERPFRSLAYVKPLQALVYVNAVGDDTGFAGADSPDMEGFAFPRVTDTTALGLTEENVRTEDTAGYGVHKGALVLDPSTGNATGNYSFDTEGCAGGALTISEESDAGGYVTVDNTSGRHVWEADRDGKKVRYFGRDALACFSLGGGYNRIYLAEGTDITDTGLPMPAAAASGNVIEQDVYLTREEGTGMGRVRAKTKMIRLSFLCDRDAPDCAKIDFGQGNGAVSDLKAPVTFGIYDKKRIMAEAAFEDDGAGVEGWSYYVASVEKDGTYEELLKHAVFRAGTENDRIPVGTLAEEQASEEGNPYVVFVRVADRVGNVRIYASKGVVLENFRDISVRGMVKAAGEAVRRGTWDGVTYFSGGVVLMLEAEENPGGGNCYSGLEKMTYVVSRHYGDGKKATEGKEKAVAKMKDGMPVFPGDVTLAGLGEYCKITKALDFAGDPEASQVITVCAEAKDHAGNTTVKPLRHTFVVDAVCPAITSSCSQVNNQKDFMNGFYANSPVTYTAVVQERFLRAVKVGVNGVFYTLEELEAKKDDLGIMSVTKDGADDISQTTDATKYRFSITFTADGDYTVQTMAADAAGNCSYDPQRHFVIDTVRPELELIYMAYHKDGTKTRLYPSRERAYADGTVSYVTAAAVVTERNFDPGSVGLTVKATDGRDREIRTEGYAKALRGGWVNKGSASGADRRCVYELTLPAIRRDANYDFCWSCADLAGNTLEAEQICALTLDRLGPEGALTVENLVNGSRAEVWKGPPSAASFRRFGKTGVRAAITGRDATSGVASVWYLVSDTELSQKSLETRTDWKVYRDEKIFKPDRRLILYGKLVDKAGNIRYIGTGGIIVDHTAPKLEAEAAPKAPGRGKAVYKKEDNPGVRVSVEDPSVRGVSAGLKKITYKIVNGTNGYTETGTLAEWKRTEHRQRWTGQVSVDPGRFYSNDVRVTVGAEDWSANCGVSEEISLQVDGRPPVVRFSFDKSDGRDGIYYKRDKELTITVEERNFDASYAPRVTSSAGGGYTVGKWVHRGEIHTLSVRFTGDGDYDVSYNCRDRAGNKSNEEIIERFTVDQTAPVIRVVYDNQDAQNGSYYKKERTAVITVDEHNFDPAQISITAAASSGGGPEVGGWSGSGDIHTAKVRFSHDAVYTLRVGGADRAGNPSAEYFSDTCTVDQTSPDITIGGIKDRSANNGTVAPVIRIRDTNFAADSTEIILTGANRGPQKVEQMAKIHFLAAGMDVKFDDFARGTDDIYTLICKAMDKAGNKSETTIRFSVNREGSSYEISQATRELLDRGHVSEPQEVVVTEINVDALRFVEISCSRDGEVAVLEEGKDYTVEKSGREDQWKKYTYRIRPSCFAAEGAYVVNMYSEDGACNTATNKSGIKKLAFTVDQTAPAMVVSNLAPGGRYKEKAHSFTLHVKDNILLDYVEVYRNGERARVCRADALAAAEGELRFTVGSSKQYQTIELIACDKAGNIGREAYDPESHKQRKASYRILVTEDSFVQFINNKPLLAGSVLLSGGILILLAMAFGKGRKKR